MKAVFKKAKVSAIYTVAPENEICIDDMLHLYDGNKKQVKRVKKMMGFDKRRVGEKDVTALDLCIEAAKNLFKDTKIDPKDIDVLIFVTQTPDYPVPASSCIIQNDLGLKNSCACFDVNLGCSGYPYGLWLAHMMVETGSAEKVLFMIGDVVAKEVDNEDKSTAVVFGDAGSSTLIEKSEKENVSYFDLYTDGSGYDKLIIPFGGSRNKITKDNFEEVYAKKLDANGNMRADVDLYMDGAAIFDFSTNVIPAAIQKILNFANKDEEDIDYFVLHQANKTIIESIITTLDFPFSKFPYQTISEFGNQSGASIPGAICNELHGTVSSGKSHLLLCGFGVGLSWGSCILSVDNILCKPIINYKNKQ